MWTDMDPDSLLHGMALTGLKKGRADRYDQIIGRNSLQKTHRVHLCPAWKIPQNKTARPAARFESRREAYQCTRLVLYSSKQHRSNGTPDQEGDIISLTSAKADLDIAHQGFAVKINGRIHLMHASSLAHRVVYQQPLPAYVISQRGQTGIMVARLR